MPISVQTSFSHTENELVEKGSTSLEEALIVGTLIEEVDIIDLAEVYEMEPGEDITALAEDLMLGVTQSPQYLHKGAWI